MSFDNPGFFVFLFLIVILAPFIAVRYRKSRERVALFAAAAPSNERNILLRELRLRLIFSDIFFLFFLGFLIVAMAGPRWGLRIVADYRRGVDLVLAFDLSESMNVTDCQAGQEKISRMERAAEIAGEFTASMEEVRLGAAIGKDRGVMAVPLTYDFETISNFLYSLDTKAITGRGTNLESLINAASDSFQDSIPSRKGIVLFSDGEALSGSVQAAVEKLRKAGIALSAVGLGSDQGGPVPYGGVPASGNTQASGGSAQGYLLSEEGFPVISARQTEVLGFGAERTGGIYIDGSRDDAAQALINYVNSLSAESRLSGYRREMNPRWQIFVLAALAFFTGSRLMEFSRRRHRRDSGLSGRGSMKNLSVMCIFFFALLFGSCAKAQGKFLIMEGNFFNARGLYTEAISAYLKAHEYEAPYAEYGLGSAYFALEEGDAALDRYKAAEKDLDEIKRERHTELRYRINYNMGIIHFEKGNYEEAAQAFREALKVDGSRIEAKRNLELSLLTISRSTAPQASSLQRRTESGHEGLPGSSSVLFEYLKEKEREQWKSREWTGEGNSSGPDY